MNAGGVTTGGVGSVAAGTVGGTGDVADGFAAGGAAGRVVTGVVAGVVAGVVTTGDTGGAVCALSVRDELSTDNNAMPPNTAIRVAVESVMLNTLRNSRSDADIDWGGVASAPCCMFKALFIDSANDAGADVAVVATAATVCR